jgi:hypothetical protein
LNVRFIDFVRPLPAVPNFTFESGAPGRAFDWPTSKLTSKPRNPRRVRETGYIGLSPDPLEEPRCFSPRFLTLHSTIALAVFRVFASALICLAYSSRYAVCAEQDGGGNLFGAR